MSGESALWLRVNLARTVSGSVASSQAPAYAAPAGSPRLIGGLGTSGAVSSPQASVLCGIADFERELIRARTGEGRKRAQARGVRFGRPPVLSVHQRQEVIQRLVEGATQADLARTYGVSQATISRLQPNPFGGASVGAPQRPNRHVGSAGRLCPVMSAI
jgi:hypothetical protein